MSKSCRIGNLSRVTIFSDNHDTNRFYRITERLKLLGYTAHDFPIHNNAWDKLVDQSKPLTDRST